MSVICPTVLASDAHDFRAQLERIQDFAHRIQIDLADGDFAPSRTINPAQVYWPSQIMTDIHLMFRRPLEHIETLVSLRPHMVIIHAEAEGNLIGMLEHLRKFAIKTGVCLLKETTPESAKDIIQMADHVLLFSGDLGHFGGQADLTVLDKVPLVKAINAEVELGWDGGANLENVRQLAEGGIDVINAGGAIQRSPEPAKAYQQLVAAVTT